MRKTKKLKKIIAIIVISVVLIYVIYAIILLLLNPNNVYILTKGELYAEDETVGYIIRDEKVIKDDENTNGIYKIATEGQKVAKDEYVFRYYKESEKELTDQIDEIDDNLLRNARLTGNPIPLIANSSGIDPEKVTNVPGQAIPTNDISRHEMARTTSII